MPVPEPPWGGTQQPGAQKEQRLSKEALNSQAQGWSSLQVIKCPWGCIQAAWGQGQLAKEAQGSSQPPGSWPHPLCPLPGQRPWACLSQVAMWVQGLCAQPLLTSVTRPWAGTGSHSHRPLDIPGPSS